MTKGFIEQPPASPGLLKIHQISAGFIVFKDGRQCRKLKVHQDSGQWKRAMSTHVPGFTLYYLVDLVSTLALHVPKPTNILLTWQQTKLNTLELAIAIRIQRTKTLQTLLKSVIFSTQRVCNHVFSHALKPPRNDNYCSMFSSMGHP